MKRVETCWGQKSSGIQTFSSALDLLGIFVSDRLFPMRAGGSLWKSSLCTMCIVHCALCTMCMHHLLTPSHLHRLRAIIFPQDWHFQYPTAEIDKEDPPAWENDQVLIFLLKNCENEGSLKPRPVSVRFIMPQRRPPTQPNLSESRSTNGITDCLSRKQQFPTKFRRNLEISQISGMTSKPKKEQKNRGCVLLSSSSLRNYTLG